MISSVNSQSSLVKSAWVEGLAVVRFVAVVLVVWAHGRRLLPTDAFNPAWFAPAHWGIELFFALSGFLIAGQLVSIATSTPSLAQRYSKVFFIKRFLRTIPTFWIASLIVIFFNIGWSGVFGQWFFEVRFAQSFPFYNPNLQTFLPVAWSLAIEEFSYVLFGCIALLISFNSASAGEACSSLSKIFLLIVLLSIGSRLLFIFGASEYVSPAFIKKSALLQVDALAFGGLAKLHEGRLRQLFSRNNLLWIFTWSISIVFLGWFVRLAYGDPAFFNPEHGLMQKIALSFHSICAYSLSRLVCAGVVVHMISIGTRNPISRFFYAKIVLPVSNHSYSTYLFHLSVLAFVLNFLPKVDAVLAQIALYLLGSFVVGFISYRLLEVPWILLRRKWTDSVL